MKAKRPAYNMPLAFLFPRIDTDRKWAPRWQGYLDTSTSIFLPLVCVIPGSNKVNNLSDSGYSFNDDSDSRYDRGLAGIGMWLHVMRWSDDGHEDGHYSHTLDLRYSELFSIDMEQAKRMAATVNAIERRMETAARRFGYPRDPLSQYRRYAEAVRAVHAVRYTTGDGDYRNAKIGSVGDGDFYLSALINAMKDYLNGCAVARGEATEKTT